MRVLVTCVLVFVSLTVFATLLALGSSLGAPLGHTGAPAVGGRTCTACHLGVANSGPGQLVITAPSVYVPGSVVPVSVSISGPQNPARNGYQMAAYDDATNQLLSGWTSPDVRSQVRGDHVGHTSLGLDRTTWPSYLQTPASGNDFTLYAAGLDADGNWLPTNDRTYTAAWKLSSGVVNLCMRALPHVGTTVPLALDVPGDGGKPYVMAASLGSQGIPIGSRVLPLSLDALFLLTVRNALPMVFAGFQGQLGPNGQAEAALNVPGLPALSGVTLHLAFIVLDPARPQSISTISNGLAVTLF